MLEGRQCLLEERHRRPVRGYGQRPLPGLAKIGNRLGPQFTEECVVCESIPMLWQPIGLQLLDGRRGPSMKSTALPLEEAAVGDLVSERMLERVRELRKAAGVVEKLRGSKIRDAATHGLFGELCHTPE